MSEGWVAITRAGEFLREYNEDGSGSGMGRPVEAGNNNELRVIATSAYGHSVAVDLDKGLIALDYTRLGLQNGTVEIENVKSFLYICEETAIIGDLQHRYTTEPDEVGTYLITWEDLIWRPIWFNRHISTVNGQVICIGAQTTTPEDQGKRNVKKLVSLFPDGRVGIS